jgi:hypothetical protein
MGAVVADRIRVGSEDPGRAPGAGPSAGGTG